MKGSEIDVDTDPRFRCLGLANTRGPATNLDDHVVAGLRRLGQHRPILAQETSTRATSGPKTVGPAHRVVELGGYSDSSKLGHV
jgi:hypothetical protein